MKKLSKILILLLSVALVCTGLILAVSASDDVGTPGASYVNANGETVTADNLSDAFANAKEGTTITLTGNTTVSSLISINKAFTFDLGGYTLTSTSGIFYLGDGSNYTFTITGEGSIITDNYIVSMNWGNNEKDRNVNVIGTGKGIDITLNKGKASRLFVVDAGTWTFENLNITADIASSTVDKLFYAHYDSSKTMYSLNVVFKDVDMTVTSVNKQSSVIATTVKSTTSLTNCDIRTDGANVFYNANSNTSGYITINNSYIDIASFSGDDKDAAAGGIFGDYFSTLKTDIVVTNSYLSQPRRSVIKYNENNSALILDNSTFNIKQNSQGKTNPMFRSMNVVFKNGSTITSDIPLTSQLYGSTDNKNYPSVNDTVMGTNMVLCEGTRIDENIYQSIITKGLKNCMSFEDKKAPGASDAGYMFVYDPVGNEDAPYLLVKISHYSSAPSLAVHWNPNGVQGSNTVNGNAIWTHYNDIANNTTKTPSYTFVKTGILQSSYNVFVYDMDFAADTLNGFPNLTIALHARDDSNPSKGNDRTVNVVKVSEGVIKTSDYLKGGDVSTLTLETGKWNHFTAVIDTTDNLGKAYIYINGIYLGSCNAWGTDENAYLAGPRFNVAASLNDGANLSVDNVMVRVNGALTSETEPTAITDNGISYLINEGKAWNTGAVNNNITVDGYAYNTIDEAIVAGNAAGVMPQINSLVSILQTITVNGSIAANGYVIPISENSIPCTITYNSDGTPDIYTFDDSYNAKVNFVFSYDGITSDSVELGIGAIPAELFDGKVNDNLEKIDNHWMHGRHVGWYYLYNGEKIDAGNPITLEFANELNGQTVTMYPTFGNHYQYYAWVIEDADGNFLRGGDQLNFWGADWTTRDWAGNNKAGDKAAHLYSGQTFVVQKDNLYFVTQVNPKNTSAEGGSDTNPEVFNFDLNGHSVLSDWRQNSDNPASYGTFQPAANDTYNIFSSRPGGYLVDVGQVKGTGAFAGGDLFRMQAKNAHINVGDVTINGVEYNYGENLTVNGNAIVRLHGTAEGSTVNIKGTTLIRGLNYNNALIYTRGDGDTDGAISATTNVTNCTIIITGGYLFNTGNSKSYYNTIFDGCTIITNENAKSLINNLTSKNSVTFNNCVTNGKIKTDGKTNTGNVIVKDTASALNAYAAPTGYVNAEWNVPMSLGAGVETVTAHILSRASDAKDSKIILTPYVIAISSSDAEANLTLGNLAIKTVETSEAVTVTYKGIGENNDLVKYYAKGGNVKAFNLPEYISNAFIVSHTGEFVEEFATNIQEAATYTPVVTATANVTGLQANVSLYADFGINLYLPAKYEGFVTVDGIALTKAMNDTYLKATAIVNGYEAQKDVVFTLNVTENIGGVTFEDTCTVTLSLVDYANAILGGENYGNADKVLVYYMMNYANEAAKYFNQDNTEVAAILENNAAIAELYTVSELNENEIISEMGIASAITEATINLEGNPAFAFKIADGFVGTITVSYAKGAASRKINVTEEDWGTFVAIKGMKAYNFGTVLNISITGTANGEEVNVENGLFSLETYVSGITAGEKHEALAYALRAYAEVSEGYKTGALKALLDTPAGEGEVA